MFQYGVDTRVKYASTNIVFDKNAQKYSSYCILLHMYNFHDIVFMYYIFITRYFIIKIF